MPDRRPKGEGSLYRFREGWRAYVTVKGHRRYFYFPNVTKAEAGRQLRARLTERDEHRLAEGDRVTLGEWVQHWVEIADLRPRVRDNYRAALGKHVVRSRLGAIRLCDLEPEDFEAYYADMLSGEASVRKIRVPTGEMNRHHNPVMVTKEVPRPLSEKTVRNLHENISAAIKEAQRRKRISWNPAALVKLPRVPRAQTVTLSPEDARALLRQAAAEPHTEARWWLALAFGLRPAEVRGLEWKHIDGDVIHVRQQLQQVKGHGMVVVEMPKTDAGWRDIPIPENVQAMLAVTRAWNTEQAIMRGWELDEHDFVFRQANGRPWTPPVEARRWRALEDAAGLPHQRLYVCRHTAARLLLDSGTPIEVVSKILGHAKTSFTFDVYVHPLEDQKKTAADAMGKLLG